MNSYDLARDFLKKYPMTIAWRVMYNDLSVSKGLIFGRVILDTIKEVLTLTNIDPRALSEIESNITEIMLKQKKEFAIESKNQE